MNLDVLTDAEAHEMLSHRLGPELVDGEAAAVTELIGLCARLPLALAIAAARHAGPAVARDPSAGRGTQAHAGPA